MKAELIVKFDFEASHSLADYEAPHPHPWKVTVSITGDLIGGKVVDIIALREKMDEIIGKLKSTYLNDNPHVTEEVRKFPTCETLSQFFSNEVVSVLNKDFVSQNPSVKLNSVMTTIYTMEGTEMGAVRLQK